MMRKLNLGAGHDIIADAVNHDRQKHDPGISLVFDLNSLPYPIQSESYQEVYLKSVIEHLIPTPVEILNEVWRILKPDGILHLKYPLYESPTIHDDPTHRWFLSESAFDCFDPKTSYGQKLSFYTPFKWQIIRKNAHKNLSMHMELKKGLQIKWETT